MQASVQRTSKTLVRKDNAILDAADVPGTVEVQASQTDEKQTDEKSVISGITQNTIGQKKHEYKFITMSTECNGEDEASEFVMTNKRAVEAVPDTWILLDSQSTCNVFRNRNLLTNIHQAPHSVDPFTRRFHQGYSLG